MTDFDTTPSPAFLRALQQDDWSVAGALSELIDNGFGPGRGNAKRVEITYDVKARTISVLDNGQGMDHVGRLFRLGYGVGHSARDIGIYGSGGTKAILWLNRTVDVWTLRDGMVNHARVRWERTFKAEEFPRVSNAWVLATPANTPPALLDVKHGTLILCHLLKQRTFYPSNVKRDLAATYAPATRKGHKLIWRTIGRGAKDEQILADPMPDLDPKRSVSFNLIVQAGGNDLDVHGQVGICEDLPASRSYVHVGFGPRIIRRTRDCFKSPDGDRAYNAIGVTGWLDLGDGWQPYLTMTKEAVGNIPVWETLMGHVFKKIEPLLQEMDDKEIALEFEGLALQLEQVLNGKATVNVKVAATATEDDEDESEREEKDGRRDRESKPPREKDEEGSAQEQAAGTRIAIIPSTDSQCDQLLCVIQRTQDEIAIRVNKEHPYIDEALKAKPTNRMVLNALVTGEIAREIIADEDLKQRVFKSRTLEQIDARPEEYREGYVHRLILDMVRGETERAA